MEFNFSWWKLLAPPGVEHFNRIETYRIHLVDSSKLTRRRQPYITGSAILSLIDNHELRSPTVPYRKIEIAPDDDLCLKYIVQIPRIEGSNQGSNGVDAMSTAML